jgi:oxygen-independent coproporphyrinogen-3 oxidase
MAAAGPEGGLGKLTASREVLDAAALLRERIMLGLRLADGFDLDEAAADLGVDAWTEARTREVARLAERGRVVRRGGRIAIPRTAWLFTDDTAARLF